VVYKLKKKIDVTIKKNEIFDSICYQIINCDENKKSNNGLPIKLIITKQLSKTTQKLQINMS